MLIHIQYLHHLARLRVDRNLCVGYLYRMILNHLRINSEQVIYMIHELQILGLGNAIFDKTIEEIGIHQNSLIYLILNHFPEITRAFGQTTHRIYQQWLRRDQVSLSLGTNIIYDPVIHQNTHNINNDNNMNNNRMGINNRSMNRDGDINSRNGDINSRNGDINSRNGDISSSRNGNINSRNGYINGRNENISSRNGNDPENNSSEHFIAWLETQQHTEQPRTRAFVMGQVRQLGDNVINQLLMRVFDRVEPDQEGNIMPSDQIDQLQVIKYSEVVQNYQKSHPNEQPYDHCPITHEAFDNDTQVVVLSCGHYFSDNIKTWLSQYSAQCPCCRRDLRHELEVSENSQQTY